MSAWQYIHELVATSHLKHWLRHLNFNMVLRWVCADDLRYATKQIMVNLKYC